MLRTLFVKKVSTGPASLIWHVICEIYYPYQRPEPEHLELGFKFWLNWIFVSIKIDTKTAWASWTQCFGSRNMGNRSSEEPWSDLLSSSYSAEQGFRSILKQVCQSLHLIMIVFIDRHHCRVRRVLGILKILLERGFRSAQDFDLMLQSDDSNLMLHLREPVSNFCPWCGGCFVPLEVKYFFH